MKSDVLKALIPNIKKFANKKVVIKYGGNAMNSEILKKSVLEDIILMHSFGVIPIVIHGGGPSIDNMLNKLNIKSKFINGYRVTDKSTVEVVQMVLSGSVNKDLVAEINNLGGQAVGISGKDASMIQCKKAKSEQKVDFGYVGNIEKVNSEIIELLINKNYIPVISPLGFGSDGETYNINADTVAGEIASVLKADKFILVSNVKGIYEQNVDGSKKIISKITSKEVDKLIEKKTIYGGMIPKVECCKNAIEKGVKNVHIIDGYTKHSLLLELFSENKTGTLIY